MQAFIRYCKKILSQTCILFTILFLSIFTLGVLADVQGWLLGLGQTYLVFLFSFVLAVSSLLLNSRLPRAVAFLLHYAVTGAVFCFLFIFWMGNGKNAGLVGVLLLAYTILYALWLCLYLLFRRARQEKKKPVYQSQFSGQSAKKK